MTRPASRRTVLAATLAVAAAAAAPTAEAATTTKSPDRRTPTAADDPAPVNYHGWTSYSDWRSGQAAGTVVAGGSRPGIVIGHPSGTIQYTDPHTGTTSSWEAASWTSPVHKVPFGATELVASWNAHTPAGTWIQTELLGTYSDGTQTPAYVMGRWASGDGDIKRTSVDGQTDGKSTIWTDTFSIDDASTGLRLVSYRLRVTLYRAPGSGTTPTVWRAGAMASDIPDRFTVPASTPGVGAGVDLAVPQYSQDIHKGQYPEYDNGGEAWCSPTSTSMVLAYHGHLPSAADMAWIDPTYADPQVDYAARFTYDWQYEGCGNWPFNAAYVASFPNMEAVVTRLHTLNDIERLVKAGLPVCTSQSFLSTELDGSGYSTSGHLMCIRGFTPEGDVIANDPASSDDAAVLNIYNRAQFETVWLRTKRYDAKGNVRSGSGGVVYVYWPRHATTGQRLALASVGIE
jgi:Peptidase_C39 like family